MARLAADAEGKLQNSHYNGERKAWDWDKYVALYKEQYAIMENFTDYVYSGMDNGIKFCHFLQGIKWRLQSMMFVPNKKSMSQISMQLCLIWVKWS